MDCSCRKSKDPMSLSNNSRQAVDAFPAELSKVEIEAIRWRADGGIVPYDVWIKLSYEERQRIGRLREMTARKLLQERKIADAR